MTDGVLPLVHSVSYGNDEIQQVSDEYMYSCNTEFMKVRGNCLCLSLPPHSPPLHSFISPPTRVRLLGSVRLCQALSRSVRLCQALSGSVSLFS